VRVVVYGSRPDGHARVVLETLLDGRGFEVVGLIDDMTANAGRELDGLGVVGSRGDLATLFDDGVEGVVLGFGTASGRDEVVEAVEAAKLSLPVLAHPSAYVARSATLAPGVQILPQAFVGSNAQLGRGVLVNTGAIVEHDVTISDFAVVDPGAVLAGRCSVGASTEIGSAAVVLPDIDVSAHAVVGAGAVVTHPVLEGETVAGVPARALA
jgi:acetyltransferase EpsM